MKVRTSQKMIPKNEVIVLTYKENGLVKYVITRNIFDRNCYRRYNNINGTLVKCKKKAKTPKELEDF